MALAGFRLGQSYIFPAASALLALLLAYRRRSLRPILGVAAVWLTQSTVVGAIKIWAGRQAPASDNVHLHAATDHLLDRMSYPSGHAANMVAFTAVVGALLAALTNNPRWNTRMTAVGVASATLCVTAMIYLNFHWATDAAAGLALGAAIRAAVIPAFTAALPTQRHPSEAANEARAPSR